MFNIIGNLKTKSFNGVNDVVTGVNWTYSITLEECEFLFNGSTGFAYNPENTFIEYPDLTKATVVGWVESVVTQDELDFYAEKAQEQLDGFKENGEVPTLANVWVTYTQEGAKDAPWPTEPENN